MATISQNPSLLPIDGLSFGTVYNGATCGVQLVFDEVEFTATFETENHTAGASVAATSGILFYFGTGYFQMLSVGCDITVTPADDGATETGDLTMILETESPNADILEVSDILSVDDIAPAQVFFAKGINAWYGVATLIGGTGEPCPFIVRFSGNNGETDDSLVSAETTWSVSGVINIFWIPVLTGV